MKNQYLTLFCEDTEGKEFCFSFGGVFSMGSHLIYWLLKLEGLLVFGVIFM